MRHLLVSQIKRSLAVSIQHGLLTVLVFCRLAILATLFLKDVPLAQPLEEEADETHLPLETSVQQVIRTTR